MQMVIGTAVFVFVSIYGGQALRKRNAKEEKLLEFSVANELIVGNSWFKKRFEHLVTNQSGDCKTQIDYKLYEKSQKNGL